MRIELTILKNRAKLEKLIRENASEEKVLKQSKKLDKLLNESMRQKVYCKNIIKSSNRTYDNMQVE